MVNQFSELNTILLVEDEPVTAMITKQQLAEKGYQVYHVTNGEDAVRFAIEPQNDVNLILMDIDLGEGIDGTEAARLILQKKEIPIVFLSEHTEPEIVEKTEQITSYGYVVKNTGKVVLDASIKMAFKLFEARQKEQRHAQALEESERKYKKLFEDHSAVKLIIDPITQTIVDANKAAVSYYGYSREKLLKMKLSDINLLSSQEIQTEMDMARQNKKTFFVFRHRLADGSIRVVNVFSNRIILDGKEYLHSIVFDVTEQHELQMRMNEMVSSIQDVIYTLDLEQRHTGIYGKWLKQFGLNEETFIGKTVKEIFGEEYAKVHEDANRKALTGKYVIYEWTLELEGVRHTFQTSLSPIYGENGKIKGLIGIGRDLTV